MGFIRWKKMGFISTIFKIILKRTFKKDMGFIRNSRRKSCKNKQQMQFFFKMTHYQKKQHKMK